MDSKIGTIKAGVPQGSVLGPLLFLLFVNDIAREVSTLGVKVMLFIDDTNVFIPILYYVHMYVCIYKTKLHNKVFTFLAKKLFFTQNFMEL